MTSSKPRNFSSNFFYHVCSYDGFFIPYHLFTSHNSNILNGFLFELLDSNWKVVWARLFLVDQHELEAMDDIQHRMSLGAIFDELGGYF